MLIFRKLTFWLALLGLVAAGSLILRLRANFNEPVPPPPVAPAPKAFANSIGGAGLVEARRENTLIGVPSAGLVTEVHVKVWDRVKVGQPLLQLDTRTTLHASTVPQSDPRTGRSWPSASPARSTEPPAADQWPAG